MSSSATCPRKKLVMKMCTDANKTQLNHEFNKRWETVKDRMQSQDRIGAWTEFVKDHWEKEMPTVREEITKQADKENTT
jgi:predicted AAA+ superfamily ATPase